jgi:hypothetical protein
MAGGGTGFGGAGTRPGGGGGAGGLLDGSKPGTALTALLNQGTSGYTWVAAAVGSQNAAGYQLASNAPVMAVGGFNGTDPAPTLAQFQEDVAEGRIHWFVGGAGSDARGSTTGGSDAAAQISEWVQQTFPARTVDGVTLHDLTAGA